MGIYVGEETTIKVTGDRCAFVRICYEAVPQLLAESSDFFVIKIPPRRCWIGRNDYVYASPELLVLRKIKQEQDEFETKWIVKFEMEDEYTRQTRRHVYERAQGITGLRLLKRS